MLERCVNCSIHFVRPLYSYLKTQIYSTQLRTHRIYIHIYVYEYTDDEKTDIMTVYS